MSKLKTTISFKVLIAIKVHGIVGGNELIKKFANQKPEICPNLKNCPSFKKCLNP